MENKLLTSSVLSTVLFLAGCGGNNTQQLSVDLPSVEIPAPPVVNAPPVDIPTPTMPESQSGGFKETSETSVSFSLEFDGFGGSNMDYTVHSDKCRFEDNDYYYETDKVLVFGSPSLPESDFESVAAMVDNEFDFVASRMGSTFDDLMASRSPVGHQVRSLARDHSTRTSVDFITRPDGWDTLDFSNRLAIEERYYRDLDYTGKLGHIIGLMEHRSPNTVLTEIEVAHQKKLYVCLNADMDVAAAGDARGLTVIPPSLYASNDMASHIRLNLVYTTQLMITDPHNFNDRDFGSSPLPHWFKSGQATVFAGNEIANADSKDQFNPIRFPQSLEGNEPDVIYPHFGLAYKYLEDANGIERIVNMFHKIRELRFVVQGGPRFVSDYNHFFFGQTHMRLFVEAFDTSGFIDADGAPLSLHRFKTTYPLLF